jgi:hypothetical protein
LVLWLRHRVLLRPPNHTNQRKPESQIAGKSGPKPTVSGQIDLYEEPEVKAADGQPVTTRVLTIMLAEDW